MRLCNHVVEKAFARDVQRGYSVSVAHAHDGELRADDEVRPILAADSGMRSTT